MIYIKNTGYLDGIISKKDAANYMKKHRIISVKDLNRIKKLAQKLGFYGELKALDIKVNEFVSEES